MIQKIVDVFIYKQLEKQVISPGEEKIYRYGYILLCEVVLNFVIALSIGIALSEMKNVLFFLCAYIPLRSFCGGWHADKIWKCTIISNAILLIMIYSVRHILKYLPAYGMLIAFLMNMVCIFFIAPVETKCRKIGEDEKYIYKKKIKVILVFHLIITIMMLVMIKNESLFVMMYVYIMQNILLLIEIVKTKLIKK